MIAAAGRQAARLAETLEELGNVAGVMQSVSRTDLDSLQRELGSLQPMPALEGLLANARALLQVIADGIVDGDPDRLRLLMSEAESLHAPRARSRNSGQIHLPAPVKARCLECDDFIVGKRQPAFNWYAITKAVRDHEREVHGVYTEFLRDELNEGLAGLRGGGITITAGRYEIGGL